jgi:hypothetical protein
MLKIAFFGLVTLLSFPCPKASANGARVAVISSGAPRALARRVCRELASLGFVASGTLSASSKQAPIPSLKGRVTIGAEKATVELASRDGKRYEPACSLSRGADESSEVFAIRVAESVRATLAYGNPVVARPEAPAAIPSAPPKAPVTVRRVALPSSSGHRRWRVSAGVGFAHALSGYAPAASATLRFAYAPLKWLEVEAMGLGTLTDIGEASDLSPGYSNLNLGFIMAGGGLRVLTPKLWNLIGAYGGMGIAAMFINYDFYTSSGSASRSWDPHFTAYATAGLSVRIWGRLQARLEALMGVMPSALVFSSGFQELASFGRPWLNSSASIEVAF